MMQVHVLDVNTIEIDDRFRSDPTEDIDSLVDSIRARGLIQPIVVTMKEGKARLKCGRRRLEAHFRLQKENPQWGQIAAVVREEMTETEGRIVELEENIRRVDFTDLEKVKAVGEIHRLMTNTNPGWTMEQTAQYLGYKNRAWISIISTVADHVTANPESPAAKQLMATGTRGNIQHAYKEIKRAEVAQAQSMLERILADRALLQQASPDGGPEARASTIIKRGDCGELIGQLPSESIYLLHTDPPYGIDFDILEKGDTKAEMYKGDSLETSSNLWRILAPELFRVLAGDSYAIIWVSFVQMPMIRQFMTEAGFECMRKPFIWVKTNGPWAAYAPSRWFASAYDSALIFAKGNPTLAEQGKPDFCTHPPLQPQEKTHPLERPVLMLADLMKRFLIPGQTVLDPFAGSGSTLVAALALKAEPIGFEKDEHFFNIAKLNVVKALKGAL